MQAEAYGIVLQRIMRDPGLTGEAKSIYAYIASFADSEGKCYPSVSLMCKELGYSEGRFYRHFNLLKERGVITVMQSKADSSRFSRNIYCITPKFMLNPSIQNEGTDTKNRAPISPSRQDGGTDNEGTNNSSYTSTSKTTNTKILTLQVLELLNEARRKVYSKGRLKSADYIIQGLKDAGIPDAQILAAAKAFAQKGYEVSWIAFQQHCILISKGKRGYL